MPFVVVQHAAVVAKRLDSCVRRWKRTVVEFKVTMPEDKKDQSAVYVTGEYFLEGKWRPTVTLRRGVYAERALAEKACHELDKNYPDAQLMTYNHCMLLEGEEHKHVYSCQCACGHVLA